MSSVATIRLLDSAGLNVLDSVSADYEDSFSLETFLDLAHAHNDAPPPGTKSFILARVQTWDIKQPGRVYWSYYNAYYLNKILFQTQVYLGKKLIHRLHVLNPLSNTDIIGDVQYFMVKFPVPPVVDPAATGVGRKDADDQPAILATAIADDTPNAGAGGGGNGETRGIEAGSPRRTMLRRNRPATAPLLNKSRAPPPSITTTSLSASPGGGNGRNQYDLPPPSPSVREAESGAASWTLMGPLVGELTEEEHTGPGPLRRKFSLATLRTRAPFQLAPAPKSAYPAYRDDAVGQASEFVLNIPASPTKTGSGGDLIPDLRVVTRPPRGTLMLNSRDRPHRVDIPAGTVTRFARPVDVAEEAGRHRTPETRRRSMSLQNHVSGGGRIGIDAVTDWSNALRVESLASDARKQETVPLLTSSYSAATLLPAPVVEAARPVVLTFDAILFATDTDYLETSRIRSVFRANAVTPDDVKLFEMQEFTGIDSPLPFTIVDDSPVCEWCFPSPDSMMDMSPTRRFFHRSKFWACILAFAVVLIVLVWRYAMQY
ncbi:hypothetical protein HKX48_005545 [Thoreauomyces humboldtii]|nr:hypothetical protein HKX48_005545 [Thoreauomyces humboldtii]